MIPQFTPPSPFPKLDKVELSGDDHSVTIAARFHPAPDDRFRFAARVSRRPFRVHVGGVDKVAARSGVGVKNGKGLLFIGSPAENVPAERERKNVEVSRTDFRHDERKLTGAGPLSTAYSLRRPPIARCRAMGGRRRLPGIHFGQGLPAGWKPGQQQRVPSRCDAPFWKVTVKASASNEASQECTSKERLPATRASPVCKPQGAQKVDDEGRRERQARNNREPAQFNQGYEKEGQRHPAQPTIKIPSRCVSGIHRGKLKQTRQGTRRNLDKTGCLGPWTLDRTQVRAGL